MTAGGSAASTLLVAPAALAGETFRIEGDAYHHLVRVKRLEVGDALRLADGVGRARFAEITSITKKEALARLGGEAPPNEPALRVELLVAPPKPERAAWLVEKATEVGVVAIRFLSTERAARAFAPAQIDRLRRIAVSAVEQCGRARVPEIDVEPSLDAAFGPVAAGRATGIALDAAGANPFSGAFLLSTGQESRAVMLLVGPEGGWTAAERGRFAAAGAEIWSLGARALRVETAAVIATGIVLAR